MSLPRTPREFLVRYAWRTVPILVAFAMCFGSVAILALMPAFLPGWVYNIVAVGVLLVCGGATAFVFHHVFQRERGPRD